MEKNRVVILGGGISGLTAAYAHLPTHDVLLLEKSSTCGGVMRSFTKEGFFFESGPRTFRTNHSPHLLQLVQELGLTPEIMASSSQSTKRYILGGKKLQQVPSLSLMWVFLQAMCREWRAPTLKGDESIYTFISRRLGPTIANRLFDPLTLGIFGCDARKISVQSAFPQLKKWESIHGSILKGFLHSLGKKKKRAKLPFAAPLFSFHQGTSALIDALEKRLRGDIHLNEEVMAIDKSKNLLIKTTQDEYLADKVISALPPRTLAHLLVDVAPETADLLFSIPMTSLTIVHIGYKQSLLSHRGFGYLVPTSEKERIMGVVFDSEIFPSHNQKGQTRLTVMLHGNCKERAEADARDALYRHLQIAELPDCVHVAEAWLPIMEVGHAEKMSAITNSLSRELPQLHLVGNYLGHPAVEHCIARAKKMALI